MKGNPTMKLSDHFPVFAKAIAAFVAPIVLAFAAILAEKIGQDVPFDPTWVETIVLALITAVSVYWVRNGSSPDPSTSTPEH